MNKKTVDALLSAMVGIEESVSDLLFVSRKPPLVEIHGHLHEFPIDTPDSFLSPGHIKQLADYIIGGNERLVGELDRVGSCDCSYAVGTTRFRVNIFKQNSGQSIVMRKLAWEVPNLTKLGLPPVFREMLKERNGIILITGSTGSGKTTTLAALIDALNETEEIHIVTLEDPIEFQHQHKKAVINQRELGRDFPTFADGLRAAMRQAPKVILLGEIRDRESMEIAMTAADTGHLVLATLHTISAAQSISRIVGLFSRDEEPQLRQRLAESLRYIASQRLVARIGGGRLSITEVIGNGLRTREAIAYGEAENRNLIDIMEAGSVQGWHTFDQSLQKAFEAGLITEETAILYCTNKNRMRRDLDLSKKRTGITELDEPSGLKLNIIEPIKITTEVQEGVETALEGAGNRSRQR